MSKSRKKSKLIVDDNGDAEIEVLVNADPMQISSVTSTKKGDIDLPNGTFVDRPLSAIDGAVRYNTDIDRVEYYSNDIWHCVTIGGV